MYVYIGYMFGKHLTQSLQRHDVHGCLMRFPSLEILHVDVSHWDPFPHDPFQRMLAMELLMFCPTLRTITFWVRQYCSLWWYEDDVREWTQMHAMARSPNSESMWRTV